MIDHRLPRVVLIAVLSVSLVVVSFLLIEATATRAVSDTSLSTALPVCFVNAGQVTCVNRPALSAATTITDQVRTLALLLIAGPTSTERAQGVQSALPGNAQLGRVRAAERQAVIGLILPDDFLRTLTDDQVEDINEEFRTTFTPFNFQRFEIDARGSTGDYRLLSDFLPSIPIPHKAVLPPPQPSSAQVGERAITPPLFAPPSTSLRSALDANEGGGLSGKTVFVSAGHGWYWNTLSNTYKTQRPVYPTTPYPSGEGIVEDFNNAEAVDQYLLPYLWNAGADAWTVRERDMNTAMLIVDDGAAGFSTQGAWSINSGGYGGTYRATTTAVGASPTATATWTFTPPLTDTYAVYARFPNVAAMRTVDARFFIDHAGAVTPITITQARDGDNWRFIGRYPFHGGRPAHVWLTNQSNTPGVAVLADAIRVGGGLADTAAPNTDVISGKPRWEEQAWTYAAWIGFTNVISYNDVIVRPIYSEWEKEAGEDAVYLAWHTNGYNGYNTTISGTESYTYLTPTLNSDLLQNAVHTQLLSEIQSGWDASWPDRGEKQDDLGEVRLLSTMPGMLIENGFHDNPIDVAALKDPRFLQLSARAIYHGLVNYWHAIDPNVPLVYLPEPPQQVMARNSGAGQVRVDWQPGPTDGAGPLGDAATSYRVYTSADGFGWSNPTEVTTTAHTLTNLAPNQLIFVKVTGINAGGESFASPVLAVRVAENGVIPVLIVYGFERIDAWGDTQQNDPPEGLSRRVFVDRINRFDYIIQHAAAITVPFDSALHAAVSNGSIGLGSYPVVDWLAGEDQAPFPSLTASDQTALANFLNNGGSLFISGAEIGYELHGTAFYTNTLRASYVTDNARTYSATPAAGGIFDGLGTINFDDGTQGTYNVDYPDGFDPINGATSALVYNTTSAAIEYANGPCGRLIYFGFPFETIYPPAARRAVMDRIMDFFRSCFPVEVKIASPLNDVVLNRVPAFNGAASSNASNVQVSIRRVSDGFFYNGSKFASRPETWLNATGVSVWSYPLPALSDGTYVLRAQAVAPAPIISLPPAAITFTLDTIPPGVPTLITPTNGITLLAVAPVFQWSGDGDATHFILDVDGITSTVDGPTPAVTRVVTDGLHIWRVRAIDAAGNQSGWSSYGQFSTTLLKVFLPLVYRKTF